MGFMTLTGAEQAFQALERRNAELQTALAATDEARMVALAANRAKTEFLAILSHELRIPLNAMVGCLEILTMELSGPMTVDQRDKLARLRRSADHLQALISHVLDFDPPLSSAS
jgi:signal transduction histidine kinase